VVFFVILKPFPKPIYNFTPLWNFCAFLAQSAKNRAFRFNLFAAGRQKGFPLQSLAPRGLTYALTC
jgi:hypothetical protein